MADVFISYHEQSAGDIAAKIADALEEAGISCWYAKRDIPPGGDFARYIPPQIDACKVFLLILNDNVYQSRHVENEVGLAFGRLNKGEIITIIPLEIGDFERKTWIRYYLVHTQSVKFQSIEEVVKKIGSILQSPSDDIPAGSFVLEDIRTGEITPFPLNDVSLQDVQATEIDPLTHSDTNIDQTDIVTDTVKDTLGNIDTVGGVETVWEAPENTQSTLFDSDVQTNAADITTNVKDGGTPEITESTSNVVEDDGISKPTKESPKSQNRHTIHFPAGLHTLESDTEHTNIGRRLGRTQRLKKWFRGAIVTLLALIILGGSITYNTALATSYVSLDVDESSIEFSINRVGRVIAVNAISADTQGLVQSLESDVKNKKVDDAMSYTMDVLKDAGYLDDANEIIASVTSNTEKRSMELLQTVAQTMEGNKKDGMKLYIIEASNGDRTAALTRKVTPGRYLIQRSGRDTPIVESEAEPSA